MWTAASSELPETAWGAICSSASQVTPVFLLAGCGMVISGCLLDLVSSTWQVFEDVPCLLILVPALLGLKGNLEMTLGARLGSHANNGDFNTDKFHTIVTSNLMAVQCQAIIVGAAASVLAIIENYGATGEWNYSHALLLATSAITAASMASLILSLLMIGIVLLAIRIGVDPDNITAPVAGMLGDFATLLIVCSVAAYFWKLPSAAFQMLCILLPMYAIIAIVCGLAALREEGTAEVMKYGWYPVLVSMLLSNLSGPISEISIKRFSTFARFQVVMNGAGGNLASILCSKLSTDLALEKAEYLRNVKPPSVLVAAKYRNLTKMLTNMGKTREDAHMSLQTSWIDISEEHQNYARRIASLKVLTGSGEMVRFARLLISLIIPGQVIFAAVVVGVGSAWTALPTPLFLACFVTASLCQVALLFAFAQTFVVVSWRMKIDPDNAASPLVCGMGDLLGTTLMTFAFMTVQSLGGETWYGAGL